MAQRVNIVLVDDIDGSEGEETVAFALDGKEYEIDLSGKNAAKLRDSLAPYIGHGRRRSGGRRGGRARSTAGGPSAGEIRDWAKARGLAVNERGRISADVRQAYDAAH